TAYSNFLQLALWKETDEAAVGRPKRKRSIFCSRQRLCLERFKRAQPELPAFRSNGCHSEIATVGREGEAVDPRLFWWSNGIAEKLQFRPRFSKMHNAYRN